MKQKIKTNDNLSKLMDLNSMKLVTMLSFYYLLVLVIFSVLQIFKAIDFNFIQIISVVLPIIIYLFRNTQVKEKSKIITIFLYLFIVLILPFFYNKTYDLTVDGNSYHKSAIAYLKNGWNPLYETAREFQKNNDEVIALSKKTNVDLWMEHYPKATWILAANIYNYTGHIESGKCITLIFSIMLLIFSFNCLRKILDKKWASLISILIVLNPIVLAQIFSYYVDGIMGIFFVMELLILMQMNPLEKIDKRVFINLLAICCIFVNLKFTGLLCSGVIAAVYYFYYLIANRKDKNFSLLFKRITAFFSIIFIIAIFLVGANSYVKNLVDHHNPLYPLMGKGKVDIITTMQPKNFKNKNGLEKFIISTFSKTENVQANEKTTLKFPLRVYRQEIDDLYIPDMRIGGFGPLNGLIACLSIILLLIILILFYKYEKDKLLVIILPLIAILATTILVGESWWARYVPQLYLIPIGLIILCVYLKKHFKKMPLLAILFSLILLVNAGCFLNNNIIQLQDFKDITQDIEELKSTKNLKIKLGGASDLYGYYYTLNDEDVKYEINNNIDDSKILYKYKWRIIVENNQKKD